MYSVYLKSTPGGARPSAVDAKATARQDLLAGVARLGRMWLSQIPAADPQREHLIRMGILAESLMKNGDHSPAAMRTARMLLCANCRYLGAAPKECAGQALDRCPLLRSSGP
ncbi:MAG: hypothetical protein NDI91_07965 [Sulfuritalea sp.]|nr:hypothetical protein [Sulfuritalea sp.]